MKLWLRNLWHRYRFGSGPRHYGMAARGAHIGMKGR
jgi:hypothetical protein